jgi:hypothetical protein
MLKFSKSHDTPLCIGLHIKEKIFIGIKSKTLPENQESFKK